MDQQPYNQPPGGQPYGTPPPPPPGYGQPPYGAPPAGPYANAYTGPQPQTSTNRWGPTSIGMDANLAAGLGYLIGILGLVFFFVEKTNRFVKFHAAQVILLGITSAVVFVVWLVLSTVAFGAAAANDSLGGLSVLSGLLTCVFGLAYLGILALWIWGMIAAFTGNYTKLPVIGDIAERWAGGPPVPVQ